MGIVKTVADSYRDGRLLIQFQAMIKFFRLIRKDLMEKNKTTKYFKYSIS
jgi:hypothetical protein